MRHFLSLVLGLILAPAIWVGVAFGMDRTEKAGKVLASATNQDRLIGAGLLVAAGLALGILLGTRLSPLGPALAGHIYLGASALALSPTSPIFHWGKSQLSQSNHTTLLVPLQDGIFWALGLALLVPLVVPSRWRRRAVAAAAVPPGAPSVPPANAYQGPAPDAAGPPQSGTPGWSANPPAAVPAGAAPSSGAGGYQQAGGAAPSSGADAYEQGRPYQAASAGGYRSEGGEMASAPGWDSPPPGTNPEQGYQAGPTPSTYPPSNYQSASAYSPSDQQAQQYSPYSGNESASENPAYPGSNYPAGGYPPATYPASTYSASNYPAQPHSAQPYPGQTYPAQTYPAQTHPATPSAPSYGGGGDDRPVSSSPAPTSYGPTTYGRSHPVDDPGQGAAAPTSPASGRAGSDDDPVERYDATRRVMRPGPPPAWGSSGDDPEQTRSV